MLPDEISDFLVINEVGFKYEYSILGAGGGGSCEDYSKIAHSTMRQSHGPE